MSVSNWGGVAAFVLFCLGPGNTLEWTVPPSSREPVSSERPDPDQPSGGGGSQPRGEGFVLEGENLDRLARRLYHEEIRGDAHYLAGLDALPRDDRTCILEENYEDFLTALSQSRGSIYPDIEIAHGQFRAYARWLKEQVLEDPIGYLDARGAFLLSEKELREWVDLLVDAFSDEDHVQAALERLTASEARELYERLPAAAGEALLPLRGSRFESVTKKNERLRRVLFDLRDRIARDPRSWLSECRTSEDGGD